MASIAALDANFMNSPEAIALTSSPITTSNCLTTRISPVNTTAGKRKKCDESTSDEQKDAAEPMSPDQFHTPKRAMYSKASSSDSPSQLPPLSDSRAVARSLLLESPVSPTTGSGFVRRSSRARRPVSPIATALKSSALHGSTIIRKPEEYLRTMLRNSFPAVGHGKLCLNRDSMKGLCVTASSFIPEGSFVVEYAGELLTDKESEIAERRYSRLSDVGCYMFYFKFLRKKFCIDSTAPGPGAKPGSQLSQHIRNHVPALPPSPTRSNAQSPSPPPTASSSSSPIATDLTPKPAEGITSSPTADQSQAIAASAPIITAAATQPTPRPELLGYGYARYINHSRNPNLSVRLIDCPSDKIKTLRFNGSLTEEEAKAEQARIELTTSEEKEGESDAETDPIPRRSAVTINLYRNYPRLCFFANRNISADEELTIDYGDRDPESIAEHPWLAAE